MRLPDWKEVSTFARKKQEESHDYNPTIRKTAICDAQASGEPLQPGLQVLLLSGEAEAVPAGQVEGHQRRVAGGVRQPVY